MVVDELEDDGECVHRAAAVPVGGGQSTITWSRAQLDGFVVTGVTMSARLQLQFNVWFSEARYATRWFQADFRVRDLDPMTLSDAGVPLERHRKTGGQGELGNSLRGILRMQHAFGVLRGKGRVHLVYAAIRDYNAHAGEIVRLVIDRIALELTDVGMFERFLAYRGHRVTCMAGGLYLYRANRISDSLPTLVDTSGGYVESSRQRSDHPNSVESVAPGSLLSPGVGEAPTRVYTWKSRDPKDAAFPSVRDGHQPAGPEELCDLAHIKKQRQRPRANSLIRRALSEAAMAHGPKRYVPDNPDYANTRFRLPRVLRLGQEAMEIEFFDFRSSPPRSVSIQVAWEDLDPDIVNPQPPSPPESSDRSRRQKSPRAALARLLGRRASVDMDATAVKSTRPEIVPKLRLTRVNSTPALLPLPKDSPTPRKIGTVTKWIGPDAKADVSYAVRQGDPGSVDVQSISLSVYNYDVTLKSVSFWGAFATT